MGKSHPNVDPYVVSRVRALESLLLDRGVLAPDAVDRVVRRYAEATAPPLFQTARHRAVACFLYQEAPVLPAHQMAAAFVEPPAPARGGPASPSTVP